MSFFRKPVWALLLGIGFLCGAAAAGEAPKKAAENASFDIWEYQVSGNTVLDHVVVEKAVYPHLGPGRSIEDVEQARQALESAYRSAGYQTALVDIPEQEVAGGVVMLKVTEGQVDRLKITGSRYFSLGRIREGVPELAEGKVPHMPTAQEQLSRLASEYPDREVTPVLRAGRTPGMVEVELKVKDELPLHGSVEMNGRNSLNTSRSRMVGMLRYDNLWQMNHSASFQYQTAPELQDVEVFAGTYVLPVPETDMRLALYGVGVSSTSDVASAGALSVVGSGQIFGLRLIKPLPAVERYFQSLTFGVDYKDFQQNIVLVGSDTDQTPIAYLPFNLRYDGSYRHEDRSSTSLSLEANFSVRGLGNEQLEFENKRFLAKSNYIYVSGELKHQQVLPYDFRLLGRVSGQLANSPLISNEQFAAGGDDTVRGYFETQELGDHGVIGSLELQTPHLASSDWEYVNNFRLLTFVEGAKLWIQDPLPGSPNRTDLASAGLGVRFEVWKHLEGAGDWAYPFIRSGTVDPGGQRIHFRLAYEF